MEGKELIQFLQQKLDTESDFSVRLELASEIHKEKMRMENTSPSSGEIECVGCGS